MADKEVQVESADKKIMKVRITITSAKLKSIERVANGIVSRSKQTGNYHTKGPVRMPTKVLKVTTRKSPNGEGSKTYDTYEMRVYKRLVDIQATPEVIRYIASYNIQPGVNTVISIAD